MPENGEVYIPDITLRDRKSAQFAGIIKFRNDVDKLRVETETAIFFFNLEKIELKESEK